MAERASRRGVTERPVRRLEAGAALPPALDAVAIEEPLEVRFAGETLAITMRTPGDDARLALGFLLAEGLIESLDDVAPPGPVAPPEGAGNRIDVAPAAPGGQAAAERLALARRGTLTTAACGVCGRRSIEDLVARAGVVPPGAPVPLALVASSPDRLRAAQPAFHETGAIHAAAALDRDGAILAAAEDVGRHNAVDKVVGALVEARLLGRPALLVVSGRTSFEIVQKAAVAKIPVVAGVSAPTSLAIDLARACGIALAGFVREGRVNLYAHEERIA